MKQKILMAPLLALTTLFTSAPIFSAAWTPEYTVRILFVNDKSARLSNSSQYNQNAISHLNSVFKKSIVKLKAEYAGSENHNGTFNKLQAAVTNQQVKTWKKQHDADFVFVWSNTGIGNTSCGTGRIVDTNTGAFAMGTTRTICYPMQTFAHEVGHNLGLNHVTQDILDKQKNNQLKNKPLYAAGWGKFGSAGFVTTMAYSGIHGGPRLDIYSTPSIHSCYGYPCGDRDSADAAKYINDKLADRFDHRRIKYPYLTLFADAYKNEFVSMRALKESTVDLNDTGFALIPENFFIPTGWKVEFYTDRNYTGEVYSPTVQTLIPKSEEQEKFRQTAYSVKIVQGGVPGFFIYESQYRRGKNKEIIGNVADLGDFSGIMSSYKLPAGWIVRFYDQLNYQGNYWTVDTINQNINESSQNNPTSYLNKIKSIEVFRQPPQ